MGVLDLVSQFQHKSEIRESLDEILSGEIVYDMAMRGWPSIGFTTYMDDMQLLRFRTLNDPILHSVRVRLDRKTGGAIADALVGAKATLFITAEVKNMLADPDDLINQWSTDFKNIAKFSLLGQVKVNHELNSIFAEKGSIIEIKDYIQSAENRTKLHGLLDEVLNELREALTQYKRDGFNT